LIPAEPTGLGGLTFVTSFFLHAGTIHLLETCISCWQLAMRWKIAARLRYLALIALAAFIGDLAHIAPDPRSHTPCIGTSGVITLRAEFPRMRLAFFHALGYVWFIGFDCPPGSFLFFGFCSKSSALLSKEQE
jgi:membrane associated rhomboid family serine protease